jgi:site-specific DNA-methyltransferase (adenine-specific)
MTTPYAHVDGVMLYHGDCLEVPEWLAADVLVTDPPYGMGWEQTDTRKALGWASDAQAGIANDGDTAARDAALAVWAPRPAVVFGSLMLAPPLGTKQVLVWHKGPNAGFMGNVAGFRRTVEAVYLIGAHRTVLGGSRDGLLRSGASMGGNYTRKHGHPHAKPLDVLSNLIDACPPGVVADPFAGSGSTLLAARNLGRAAIGVEIEERYCEIIATRLAQTVLL